MAVYNYDVVVLGSGPAGEGAAMNAAKAGRKVAMVDSRRQVGGNCTHLGTIPSKALRHSVRQIMQFNTNPMFRAIGEPRWFSFPDVLKNAEKVITKQVASRTGYYARNRVDVFFGTGSFADEHTIDVVCANGAVEKLVANQIIIATGSRPYRPVDIDFSSQAHLRQRHHPQPRPHPAQTDHLRCRRYRLRIRVDLQWSGGDGRVGGQPRSAVELPRLGNFPGAELPLQQQQRDGSPQRRVRHASKAWTTV